ncbi:MAG: SelB C-terminal domain-containing protein [Spirochaetales bacterium]|nr:SelB C-terminal domain-containing protein [Spirochaetales bacterium]
MAEQRINRINISCLEILDNSEQGEGGKFISILCRSRGEDSSGFTGQAVLLPAGKKLTVRKIEKKREDEYIAVLKGIVRSDLKRRQVLVPLSYAVSAGKEAFFLLPSSKERLEKGNYFVSGGLYPEYNGENAKPSAAVTLHGRVASFRFFYDFPLVPGAKYFIAEETNRDLRTPVTLVYPGKLNQKESSRLADRLLKYGGRPSLKAIYSIILRTDSMVHIPDFLLGENFDGSIRSGNWIIMSREYDRIRNAVLKRSAAFGGVPEKELSAQINGVKPAILQIIEELIDRGTLVKRDGYILNGEREGGKSLSPMASKLLEDLKGEEEGVSLSLVSNPLVADTYRALVRLGLVKKLEGEIILHKERYEMLAKTLFSRIKAGDELDLGELKELLPLSRRLLIPLLEEMDKEGYFEWKGDKRVVLEKG